MFARSAASLAGGVASNLRRAISPTPLFISEGKGALLTDVDGNVYIDYTLAYGPVILGHAPEVLARATARATAIGSTFGAQHVGEIELAEHICRLVPSAERVCFSSSGTEAVLVALRLARAFTGRQKIVRFAGHYHGWSDAILAAADGGTAAGAVTQGQSAAALHDLIVLQWNDLAGIEQLLAESGQEIAAVVCEPIACNSGCLWPRPGYLQRLLELAHDAGALLIFDEVITGFRVAPGGAQELLGVTPDLSIFGKALAGGFPLSAVAGRAGIMDLIASGAVDHMGTMNGNTLCTAAAIATLGELTRDDAVAFGNLREVSAELVQGLRTCARRAGVPMVVNDAGPVFHVLFTDEEPVDTLAAYERRDIERGKLFARGLLEKGIYARPSGLWYVSTAHEFVHVRMTLAAVEQVLAS